MQFGTHFFPTIRVEMLTAAELLIIARRMSFTIRSDDMVGVLDFCLISTP